MESDWPKRVVCGEAKIVRGGSQQVRLVSLDLFFFSFASKEVMKFWIALRCQMSTFLHFPDAWYSCFELLRWPVWYPKLDQNVCLNMVKKTNCVVLHSRREIEFWKFYAKWLLWKPTTASWCSVLQHWRQHFLLFYKTRFDCEISISCKFLFCSEHDS